MKITVEYQMPDDREAFELTQKSFQMLNTITELHKQVKWIDDVGWTEENLHRFLQKVRATLAEAGNVPKNLSASARNYTTVETWKDIW